MKYIYFILSTTILFSACNEVNKTDNKNNNSDSLTLTSMIPDKTKFESTIDGKKATLYTIKNSTGMEVAITNYGGRIVSIIVPDKNGKSTDVVVGFKSVKDYANSTEPYFGATIGRYGNRIAKGTFSLDNKTYHLFINNQPNTLHGGKRGFQAVIWDAVQLNDSTLQLSYLSKNGEENFPGNLSVQVTFSVLHDNSLDISYSAETDKNTFINLTNHAFFNLNGEGSGTILNHTMQIFANSYTPVDSTLIPTGKIEKVQGTPFDFTSPTLIGKKINDTNDQLKFGKGYDHNFVLNDSGSNSLHEAAIVKGDKTDIEMQVLTKEPGLQFYSGNFMQSKNTFKGGTKDDFRTAFCLETQHFPNSPNQPNFPTTLLIPGRKFNSETVYRFSVTK